MAAKQAAKKKSPKIEFQGYLNVNLSAEQDEDFDNWLGGSPDVFKWLFEEILLGYKLGFAEDEFNDGFSASLYAKSAKLPWAGWTLTAWAGSVEEAAALLWYKHHNIANKDWEQFTGRPSKSHSKRG